MRVESMVVKRAKLMAEMLGSSKVVTTAELMVLTSVVLKV